MKTNGQCKFVMGAMLGYLWCTWCMIEMPAKPYNFLAKFIVGLSSILGLAVIDQTIELRRNKLAAPPAPKSDSLAVEKESK